MNTRTEQFRLDFGDVLEIQYDGTMYVDPSTGAQYSTRGEAMRDVLHHYMLESSEDLRDEHGEIEHVALPDYGVWID